MNNFYIVDLEYIESRYTAQWKTELPKYLKEKLPQFNINVIEGNDVPQMVTPGAFLNFGGTTVYKAQQIEKIARLFCEDKIQDGDQFLFTDFWHPGILFLKYMSTLLGKKIETHGLIHAGSYDKNDFLGRVENKSWLQQTELAMFEAFDHTYFATCYHYDLFCDTFFDYPASVEHIISGKVRFTGWLFDFIKPAIQQDIVGIEKENIIVFPHRLAPEKQYWTFLKLKEALPEFEFVTCQDKKLSKKEYHRLLGRAKIVWSASLQETLGISTCIEGPIAGCIPLAPNDLSYREIFQGTPFVYNSAFVRNEESFDDRIEFFKTLIRDIMINYDSWKVNLDRYVEEVIPEYGSFESFVGEFTTTH